MTSTSKPKMALGKANLVLKLSQIDQPDFVAMLHRRKIDPSILPDITLTNHEVNVVLGSISDEDIVEEFGGRDLIMGGWLDRVYRSLAEYDVEAAMDELYRQFRQFGLASPSTEVAIVDLLTGTKASPNVRN